MSELKIIRMSDIRPEPVDWLWEPYIAYGAITQFQGDGEQGKTMATLAIAAALTKGETLPNGSTPIPSNVIVQNSEDSYNQTIRPRLEMLGADCEKIFVIDDEEQPLTLADDRIEQAIIQTNAKMILLDPVQSFFGRANMNSAGGVRPLMKKLGKVAARHNCVVLLVGHLNKQGGKSQYAGLGSIDIFAAARSVLTVGSINKEENIKAIVHNKSNLAPAGKSQAFKLDPISGFSWLGDCEATIDEVLGKAKKPESQFAKARRFIETILANGPVLSVDLMEKAEEQGISISTLNRAKEELGVVSYKEGKQWFWTLPIEAEYTDVTQVSQPSQDGGIEEIPHILPMTNLSNLRNLALLPEHSQQAQEGF